MELGPEKVLFILLIVVLLFGSSRLPKLARSIGEAQRELRNGLHASDPASPAPGTSSSLSAEQTTTDTHDTTSARAHAD